MDRGATGEQRRMLCIQLEIAADVESPNADRDRRMQYQLEQMNQSGLGQHIMDHENLLEKLEIDWMCLPGAEPELQQELDERFHSVLDKARNRA
jgi:hypothetical protein